LPQSILNNMPSENAPRPKPCLLLSQHQSFGHPTSRTGDTPHLFQRGFSREGRHGPRSDQLAVRYCLLESFLSRRPLLAESPTTAQIQPELCRNLKSWPAEGKNTSSRLLSESRESAGSEIQGKKRYGSKHAHNPSAALAIGLFQGWLAAVAGRAPTTAAPNRRPADNICATAKAGALFFPVFFPVMAKNDPGSGSLYTASTATQPPHGWPFPRPKSHGKFAFRRRPSPTQISNFPGGNYYVAETSIWARGGSFQGANSG